MSTVPVIYLLQGDDTLEIAEFIKTVKGKMGDLSTAEMNTVRMEGRVDLGELKKVTSAVPFLATRRLVVLDEVTKNIRSQKDRKQFLDILDAAPVSTAVILIQRTIPKKSNWVMNWAAKSKGRTLVLDMIPPKGSKLVKWIQTYAVQQGGEILPQAAQHLVSLIGDDKLIAAGEVDKLLSYVNFVRPIEIDDVELLIAPIKQANVFSMVDAIGAKNGRLAISTMHDLLEDTDGLSLFGMIVRQFRLLVLYKDLNAKNLPAATISSQLNLPGFVVSKLATQARNFSLSDLENIYADLAKTDLDVKTGKIEIETALDTFVATVTSRTS